MSTDRMRAGFYCGKLAHLQGRRALVIVDPDKSTEVKVQFDDPVTRYGAGDDFCSMADTLNFGWHRFPAADFDLDIEADFSDDD